MGKSQSKPNGQSNIALVFVKPHAANEKVINFVRDHLQQAGCQVLSEATVLRDRIVNERIIDKHYFSISEYAFDRDPKDLLIHDSKKKDFLDKFGFEWQHGLDNGLILNSKVCKEKHGLDSDEFTKRVRAGQNAGLQVKLAPGLYVCKLDQTEDTYVINGFYEGMRAEYVAEGASIHYFVVRFDPSTLSWSRFRGSVIGDTDPGDAEPDSVRGKIAAQFEQLGVSNKPTKTYNCVHASAGPLEGLRERIVWTGATIKRDEYGRRLLKAGISAKHLEQWLQNAVATIEGTTGPIFDLTELLDSEECLGRLKALDAEMRKSK